MQCPAQARAASWAACVLLGAPDGANPIRLAQPGRDGGGGPCALCAEDQDGPKLPRVRAGRGQALRPLPPRLGSKVRHQRRALDKGPRGAGQGHRSWHAGGLRWDRLHRNPRALGGPRHSARTGHRPGVPFCPSRGQRALGTRKTIHSKALCLRRTPPRGRRLRPPFPWECPRTAGSQGFKPERELGRKFAEEHGGTERKRGGPLETAGRISGEKALV